MCACLQRRMQDENLKKQEESVQKQEAMRRGEVGFLMLLVHIYCWWFGEGLVCVNVLLPVSVLLLATVPAKANCASTKLSVGARAPQ